MRLSYEGLLHGTLDVAELLGPYEAAARKDPRFTLLYDSSSTWRELFGTWPIQHCFAAYTDVLEKVPELPRWFHDAVFRSREYGRQHAHELLDRFLKTHGDKYLRINGKDGETLRAELDPANLGDRFTWSLTDEDKKTIQTALDLSFELGYVKKRHGLDDVIYMWS